MYQFAAIMGLLNICFFDFGFWRFFGTPDRFFRFCNGRAMVNGICKGQNQLVALELCSRLTVGNF
jgi:hypothetical protein